MNAKTKESFYSKETNPTGRSPRKDEIKPAPEGALYFTRYEVAHRYRVAASTVSKWAKSGFIKKVPFPQNKLMFPLSEIERLDKEFNV